MPKAPASQATVAAAPPPSRGAFGFGPHEPQATRSTVDAPVYTGPNIEGGRCPEGMSPIPAIAPRYCIDTYEVAVEGDFVVSRAGMTPTAGLSFDAAREACARSPVIDAKGKAHGFKRLVSSAQWEDAADGVVGPGGRRWPIGNAPNGTVCATLDLSGRQLFQKPLATGAMPDCKSAFGVYDQLGNLWEWMDSGFRVDRAAWIAARGQEGVSVTIDADDRVRISPPDARKLDLLMNDVDRGSVVADSAGGLYIQPNARRVSAVAIVRAGFLVTTNHVPNGSEDLLSVVVAPLELGRRDLAWGVYARGADEGSAIPDKRGCAHYTGGVAHCTSAMSHFGHTRDFSGSIGFRCVADPLPG